MWGAWGVVVRDFLGGRLNVFPGWWSNGCCVVAGRVRIIMNRYKIDCHEKIVCLGSDVYVCVVGVVRRGDGACGGCG